MTQEEMRDATVQFLIENFLFDGKFELSDDDSLQDRGVVDSAGVLLLISFLEEQFDISVGQDDVRPENLDTVANLTSFIVRKRAA
jgi:acyl carrier protein